MTQLHGDPEKLIKLASAINNDPWAKMMQATNTLDNGCRLDGRGFGTIGSAILGGSYDDARARFEQNTKDAASSINDAAIGLANVANLYAQAEGTNASMLALSPITASTDGIAEAGNDGFGSVAFGLGAYAGDIILFPIFVAVQGSITACAAMAPAVFIAETLWMLTKPDDTELNGALGAWRAAADDVQNSRSDLQNVLSLLLDDAWPPGDGARPQFDTWMKALDGDLGQLQTAIAGAPDVFANAANEVHQTNQWLLVTVVAALATMIALTACDVFFGAGEAAKNVVAAVLIGAVSSAVASVLAIIGRMAVDLGTLISDDIDFGHLGQSGMPDFAQLPAAALWQGFPNDAVPQFSFGSSSTTPTTPSGPLTNPPR